MCYLLFPFPLPAIVLVSSFSTVSHFLSSLLFRTPPENTLSTHVPFLSVNLFSNCSISSFSVSILLVSALHVHLLLVTVPRHLFLPFVFCYLSSLVRHSCPFSLLCRKLPPFTSQTFPFLSRLLMSPRSSILSFPFPFSPPSTASLLLLNFLFLSITCYFSSFPLDPTGIYFHDEFLFITTNILLQPQPQSLYILSYVSNSTHFLSSRFHPALHRFSFPLHVLPPSPFFFTSSFPCLPVIPPLCCHPQYTFVGIVHFDPSFPPLQLTSPSVRRPSFPPLISLLYTLPLNREEKKEGERKKRKRKKNVTDRNMRKG